MIVPEEDHLPLQWSLGVVHSQQPPGDQIRRLCEIQFCGSDLTIYFAVIDSFIIEQIFDCACLSHAKIKFYFILRRSKSCAAQQVSNSLLIPFKCTHILSS